MPFARIAAKVAGLLLPLPKGLKAADGSVDTDATALRTGLKALFG